MIIPNSSSSANGGERKCHSSGTAFIIKVCTTESNKLNKKNPVFTTFIKNPDYKMFLSCLKMNKEEGERCFILLKENRSLGHCLLNELKYV